MNSRPPLRLLRYASILGICVLAGYYAGRFAFAPTETSITPQMLTKAEVSVTPVDDGSTADPIGALPATLPDIQLNDLQGQPHSVADWSDGPLLINFWATWCAPCLREMPMLEAIWQERRNESLTILGIAVDRLEAVEPYIEKTGVTYPMLVGQSDAMEAAEAFGPDFGGLPYTVFVAAGGGIVGVYSGELHAEQLERILDIVADASTGLISIDAARAQLAE